MDTHERKVIDAVHKVLPAIVSVIITKEADFAEHVLTSKHICVPELALPRDEDGKVKIGGGSGFFVSDNGLVLTNKHVVMDEKADYTVFDQKGQRRKATVLGRDPIFDIAILKIETDKKLPFIKLKPPKPLRLGQTVIAIGNALGEDESTVSTGVVSGLSRFVTAITDLSGHQERLRGLIQTDAAINVGNSGGPLLNLDSNVVGINAAVVYGAQNIGFAIPIAKAIRDVKDIQTYGRIRRPFLGVRYIILNQQLQKKFNFSENYGAMIVRENIPGDHAVVPGSAAEKAGIKESDIILICNGEHITERRTLEDILESVSPGEKVTLILLRGEKREKKSLTIEEWG